LTAPSKLAAKEMDRLGISMYDTNGRFIGMEGAAQELQEKLGSLSAAQRNAALEIIFGREAMTGATVLYKGGAAAVRDWTDKVNDQGFAAEQAGKLMDNLAGDVEKLKGSLETAFISSGSGANDGLRAIVSTVDGAVDAFNGLPGPVQKSTVVIAAVGGAALIATAGLLKLVGAAAAAKVNLAALGVSAATTKASLVAVGKVGAAAAGLYALGQAADEINSSVGDSAVTVADLSKALEELGKRGQSEIQVGKFGKGFEDIGKQLKELSQADLLDRFNDAQASFLNFIQLRDLPEGRQNRGKILEDFRRLDAELTRMVNSGNLEGAQEQFGLLNQKAIAGGAGVNQLARHLPQYEAAVAQAGQTTEDAAGAADGYTASQRGALAASKALEAGQEGLKTALDAASNAFLVGRSASRDYQAAIDAAKESAKTNGETLDENTEKGRANAASLDALATSSLAYLGTLTGPNGEATPKFNRALEDSRVRLIAAARGFGMGEAAAKAYAAKILDVPAEAVTRVTLLNARNAIAQITTLRENLGRIPGSKTVFFRVEGLRGLQSAAANARDIASADGNIIRYYGSGGVENHVAQIARPKNTVRIWAEPETGGEAYIPLAPSKRQRSKAILKQTAGILGMQAFAAGGFSSPFGASDVQQRYTALLPQPITPQQYAAAMKAAADAQGRTANAADRLRAAERDLTRTRRDSPRDAGKIRDAEDDLNKARRAHAAARRAESAAEAKAADATRRKNAGRGFNLGLYINALGQTTRQAESYRRNLSAVSRRGGSDLAAALEAMGADGAPLIAALVRASPAQFKRVANLLRRLDPSAFGGGQKVTRFAAGGIAPATMGGWRVFGEAGSDEAFIPLDRSKQARSRMLTADVAGRLGGQVTWSTHRVIPGATGVSAAPSSSVASGAGVSMNVGTVQLLRGGPEDVANDVMFRVRQLGG
jgi:hypothetical protein